jgi:hypothetical protein
MIHLPQDGQCRTKLIQINAQTPERAAMKRASGFYSSGVSRSNANLKPRDEYAFCKKTWIDYFELLI